MDKRFELRMARAASALIKTVLEARKQPVTGSKISVPHFVLITFRSFIPNIKSAILCVSLIENTGLK